MRVLHARMPVESQVQAEVTRYARERGWLVRRLQYIGRVGAPDIIAFRAGGYRLVEFKGSDGKLRPGQVAEHATLSKHGVLVYVIEDLETGYALFR